MMIVFTGDSRTIMVLGVSNDLTQIVRRSLTCFFFFNKNIHIFNEKSILNLNQCVLKYLEYGHGSFMMDYMHLDHNSKLVLP